MTSSFVQYYLLVHLKKSENLLFVKTYFPSQTNSVELGPRVSLYVVYFFFSCTWVYVGADYWRSVGYFGQYNINIIALLKEVIIIHINVGRERLLECRTVQKSGSRYKSIEAEEKGNIEVWEELKDSTTTRRWTYVRQGSNVTPRSSKIAEWSFTAHTMSANQLHALERVFVRTVTILQLSHLASTTYASHSHSLAINLIRNITFKNTAQLYRYHRYTTTIEVVRDVFLKYSARSVRSDYSHSRASCDEHVFSLTEQPLL